MPVLDIGNHTIRLVSGLSQLGRGHRSVCRDLPGRDRVRILLTSPSHMTAPATMDRGGDGNRPVYVPRFNEEAEQGLIGAILCNNHYLHRVERIVSERQFGIGVHARLWAEIGRRIGTGSLADPLTLKAWAEGDEALKPIGGA